MIYKMISSKAAIAKVIADLGLDENKIKISDIREWVGESVSKIGSISLKKHKVVVLPLAGYQCKLPCELLSIDMIAYSKDKTNWSIMKKVTGSFSICSKAKNTSVGLYNLSSVLKESCNCEPLKDKFVPTVSCEGLTVLAEYDIKPGYLLSNMKDGFVKISYYAEHTDDDGMPLIPDLPSYMEAVYWYVAMKLLYIEYFTGRKPQHLYYDAKRSWNFYRQQAYAESLMPDTANEVENIKNTWHTLVPEVNEIDTFFYNTGDEQLIYNAN